jgi:hypothetical protein
MCRRSADGLQEDPGRIDLEQSQERLPVVARLEAADDQAARGDALVRAGGVPQVQSQLLRPCDKDLRLVEETGTGLGGAPWVASRNFASAVSASWRMFSICSMK